MADASHLERMGRELKCPICLSLFNSAVSLTCNHVFCNSCIEKSIKAASNCPVCKVPYRRREIRPAPHMDNLVSVYKSMEVASGVSIFVTQTQTPTGPSGNNNQTGADIEVQNNGLMKVDASDIGNQRRHQRRGSKTASVFPTKKRVQLPPCTSTRAETEQVKLDNRIAEVNRNETKRCPVLQSDILSKCEKGEQNLHPFFWLREEEVMDKSSQQTDDNLVMYTPPEAPCFSDLKDSDDERGTCNLSNNADFVGSEMFDWTQRPCSPELCSSPPTIEIDQTVEEDVALKRPEAASTKPADPKSKPKSAEGKSKRRRTETSESKGRTRTSNKKVKGDEHEKDKKAKIIRKVTAVCAELGDVIYQDMGEGSRDTPLIQKGKSRKGKHVLSDAGIQDKNVAALSDGIEKGKDTAFTQVSDSENHEKSKEGHIKSKKKGEGNKKSTQRPKSGSKRITQKSEIEKKQLDTEQDTEGLIAPSLTNLHPPGNGEGTSDRSFNRNYGKICRKLPSLEKKVKFSVESMCKDSHDGIALGDKDTGIARDHLHQENEYERDQSDLRTPIKVDKSLSSLKGHVLVKCNSSPSTMQCAFCQSSKESEASGIMVHYINGKLVTDDLRKTATHVHKHCAEWAPNVYFEDDNVVNLENELSRSRRIRCCCCGIKGAALGCYEKTCRKSFHVPCAKLTPECRWDSENFVMLCPIHKASQMPSDIPQSQSKKKRKSSAERKSCLDHDKVKTNEECKDSSPSQWKSQKKLKNLVFCCSALTDTEKETVVEFENLSGVTILKSWDPTVTHVIASTDENGSCRRTLKFLMGVLEGKWIMSVQWIKACIEAGEIVDEEQFEISVDIHGIKDGPKLGRLRLLHKQPKLFDGYSFYFMGDFTPAYKGYLHDLVIAAGGKVLNRKPVKGDQTAALNGTSSTTFIIYSVELPEHCKTSSDGSSVMDQRRACAEALATSAAALVASNSWIMNSIAGYKLQKVGK